MTGNGNVPYICYFQLSCFAKENTKQSDHAGPAAASIISYMYTCTDCLYYIDDTATVSVFCKVYTILLFFYSQGLKCSRQ